MRVTEVIHRGGVRRSLSCVAAVLALALAGCRGDTTGAGRTPAPLASEQPDEDPPRFSEWSAPVNLGTVVNTPFVDSDPFISRDGLSLYFVSGQGRGGSGQRDVWVATRASTRRRAVE